MRLILIACLLPATCFISAAHAVSRAEIGKAIRQLSSPDFGHREKAQDQLLDVVKQAEDALRNALKENDLGKEARERIGYILSFVNVPAKGVVWRGRNDKRLTGTKDGDILIAIDGRPVENFNWFIRVTGDYQPMRRLTMWRNGKGMFELQADTRKCSIGFSAWPDYIELYRRYGHRGKWDATVEKAIRLTRSRKPAEKAFQVAWKAGCRDVLMVSAWFHFYTEKGDTKAAEALRKKLPADLKGDYPGGWYRHGWLKRRIAAHLIRTGKRAKAIEYLDIAVKDAIADGAWKGLPALRWQQMTLKLLEPIDQAEKFWVDNAGEICTRSAYTRPSEVPALIKLMAHRLAAEDGLARALAFLEKQPDCHTVRLLKSHYRQQKLLAAQSPGEKRQETAVLLQDSKWVGISDAPLGRFSFQQLAQRLSAPCRVECEVRMVKPGVGLGRWHSTVKVFIQGTNKASSQMWLDRNGRIMIQISGVPRNLTPFSESLVNPTHWMKISYEIHPHVLKCSVRGIPILTFYSTSPNSQGQWFFGAHCSGNRTEYRNLRIYALTTAKVDANAVEKHQRLKAESIRKGLFKRAKASHEKLLSLLGRVKEAKGFLEEMKQNWEMVEAIMSEEGLSLCSEKMFKAAKETGRIHGNLNLSNGCIEMASGAVIRSPMLRIPLLAAPDDIEVTGVIEFEKPARNTVACFGWTTDSQYTGMTRCIFWPALRLAQLGERKSTRIKNVDFSSAMPFCIRVRGGEAVVFLRFGAKPDMRIKGLKPIGTNFCIWANLSRETRLKVSKLRIRHLPKKTKLDEPVRMPTVDKKSTGDKRQEW